MLYVGKLLGKTLEEVSDMPLSEVSMWLSYGHFEKEMENKPISEKSNVVDITNSPEGLGFVKNKI